MSTRSASHAGSWYSGDRHTLASELDKWLDDVPTEVPCIRSKNVLTDERPNASICAIAHNKENTTVDAPRTTETNILPVTGARVIIAP